MKIVQINCVYGQGSTGRLTQTLHRALLERGEDSLVFYGRGGTVPEKGAERLSSELYGKINGLRARVTGLPYGGCELATARLLRRLHAEEPDLVHLQCPNGSFVNLYELTDFLRREGIPTVVTLHAEFFYTANCSHAFDCGKWKTGCGACAEFRRQNHAWFFDRTAESWRRMECAFRGFERLSVVAVSPWQGERAAQSPFFGGARRRVILNGVDTSVFRPTGGWTPAERKRILYVTPRFDATPGHIKGGAFALQLADMLGDRAELLVVGPAGEGSVPANVRLLGPVREPEKLARLYAEADVTLLTSRRETFSMVAAESLCCGTPVAGFRAGGPESIAIPAYSRFCAQGDLEALAEAVLSPGPKDPEAIGAAAACRYGKERMIEEYLDEYKKVRNLPCE